MFYFPPSTWKLLFGGVCSVYFIWLLLKTSHEVSTPFFTGEQDIKGLKSGIEGLNYGLYDGSDSQYSNFLKNLKNLVLYFTVVIVGKNVWEVVFSLRRKRDLGSNDLDSGFAKHITVLYSIYYALQGFGFTCYLHGFTSIYYFSALICFYFISKLNGSKMNAILTWLFAILVLFSSEYFHGYHIFEYILGEDHWLATLIDTNRGPLHWEVYFRMTMLRVISFNFDKYWACNKVSVYQAKDKFTKRIVDHLPLDYFGFFQFVGYVLYPQLYIAGPIITFNSFISQFAKPVKDKDPSHTKWTQAAWTLILNVVFFVLMHYTCINAISISYVWKSWEGRPMIVGLIGFQTLVFMYFKFLCMWRFFRTFALLDNIYAPKNMLRCMHNSYTFADFWRAWHSSFNKWTVRYLYIPLGGTNTQHFSIWLIFFFIGLWHDLWWSWVAWAWMNCLFFTIELAVTNYWSKPKFDWIRDIPGYDIFAHICASWNATFILCSNLTLMYGFDHMPTYLYKLLWAPGTWFVYLAICFLGGGFCLFMDEVKKREFGCPFRKPQMTKEI